VPLIRSITSQLFSPMRAGVDVVPSATDCARSSSVIMGVREPIAAAQDLLRPAHVQRQGKDWNPADLDLV
jgi:hypothetical protein